MGISEFELIDQAFRQGGTPTHPLTHIANGDDASVHALQDGMELVVSTDISMAGVHWPHDFPLDMAADRAICAALSDLAAMGAEGCWAWVSVMTTSSDDGMAIGAGVNAALKRHGIELAGGDTVHASCNAIAVTVAGQVPEGVAMRRDKAQAGDDIWLCGNIGHAALGLAQWQQGEHDGPFVNAFARVEPLLETGISLRKAGVRCCIDISDGLFQDASHLADASHIALDIQLQDCPGWDALCRATDIETAEAMAAGGGEDYALLFTAPADFRWKLEALAAHVGVCKAGAGVQLWCEGHKLDVTDKGYDHFA
ncbi:MAG: thiamine-phosphate kinase [Mariprofundaceae bacterium]